MKLRPLRNVMVVEKERDERVSSGGITLITIDPAQARIGKVISMGDGVYDEKRKLVGSGVKIGDRIAYLSSHEKIFEINHEKVVCILANGVLGILPPK